MSVAASVVVEIEAPEAEEGGGGGGQKEGGEDDHGHSLDQSLAVA